MKTLVMSALVLSAITSASFAKESAGSATAGNIGKSTLISISGAPAKKIYSILAMKGDFTRLNSNTVGTLKTSPEISCLNVSGVDAYQCKVKVASNGRAEEIKFSETAKTTKEAILVEAGGMNDYANVTITGAAAKLIMDNLKAAKTTSKRTGSLITTTTMGESIQCTFSAEVALNYTCRFSVTANGNVEANFAR
jgi:hypothetical protein